MLERASSSFKGINALLVTHDSIMIGQYIILPLKIFQTSWHAYNSTFLNPIIAVTRGRGGGYNKHGPTEETSVCSNLYFTFQHLSVRHPIYLSEHILGGMSELYWQRWGELGDECTYCSVCTHPVHSILGNCSASKKEKKKKLSLFCHSASQVTFRANKLSGWKKGERKGAIGL